MTRKTHRHTSSPSSHGTPAAAHTAPTENQADAARADRLLVDRCLLGEVAAWEELYQRHHSGLCALIKSLLQPGCRDRSVVDEIAARVWYAIVRNDGELLGRFDPQWGLRLATFLRGLARIEMLQFFRAEHRYRAREAAVSRRLPLKAIPSEWEVEVILNEFTATLTPGEQRFLEEYLLLTRPAEADTSPPPSDTSVWQRRHRIRSRLVAFFRDED
jgi:hypothetical protein